MQQDPYGRVALPSVDQAAKEWELELSRRVGAAIQARRKGLGLTAQQLAERTKDFHYHVTRVAISKIEGNLRAGKLDVAELLVLAAALDIPPALLLFPEFPNGSVELLPDDREASNYEAVKWLAGQRALPLRRADAKKQLLETDPLKRMESLPKPNPGTQLVAAVDERDRLNLERLRAVLKSDLKEAVDQLETEGATVRVRIAELSERLDIAKAAHPTPVADSIQGQSDD